MVALSEERLVPSVSKKQERFMQAVAHNPAFAKKAGVPQSVGKEFTKSGGGMAESKKMVKKEVSFMKSKGAPKSMIKHEMSEAGMKKGGMMKKMAKGGYADGGMPMVMKDGQKVPAFAADGKGKMKHGGMAMKKMASGGMTSMGKVKTAAPSRDGIAVKGKTVGKNLGDSGKNVGIMGGAKGMNKGGMSKMKKGGYC
jgi:hypothetical protein